MKSRTIWYQSAVAALAVATVFSVSAFSLADQPEQNIPDKPNHEVCTHVHDQDAAHCQARVVDDGKGKTLATTSPTGYSPAQFHTAYNLPAGSINPTPQIIAIVDAYDDPTIKADLDNYSTVFGLPILPNCVGAVSASLTPCFQKVNQLGGTSYPAMNSGWALEISLDVEVAHAICPNCSLLLVESDSNSFANLLAAEDRAVTMGANEVSNSWGAGEFSGETTYDSHFNHTGVAFTVSSGDSGYGAEYPSSSPFVTSVGGTTLRLNFDNSYNSESAWSGGGSGCSNFEAKPAFQAINGCAKRITADVSADANPSTGASVYDTTPYSGQTGWFQVGGTSLSAPLIAGVYALAGGVPAGVQGNSIPYIFYSTASLHDVTTGNNGRCKRVSAMLCTAGPGYDGPTGLGTPNGTASF